MANKFLDSTGINYLWEKMKTWVAAQGYKTTDTNTWRPVVNNLTSTSTDSSLSAAQGKALNDKFANYLPISNSNGKYFNSRSYINHHPENGGGSIIPFLYNDLAHLLSRGGSCSIYTTSSTDFTAASLSVGASISATASLFDGTPSYQNNFSSYLTAQTNNTAWAQDTLVIDITLHKTFSYSSVFYIDFGNTSWYCQNIQVLVMRSSSQTTYTSVANVTGHAQPAYYTAFDRSSTGFDKLRIILKQPRKNLRIAQIGLINYGSSGVNETFVSRAGTSMYGSLYPYTNKGASLGTSNNMWSNIYGGTIYENGKTLSSTYQAKGNYLTSIPTATSSTLGGVKIQSGNVYGYTGNASDVAASMNHYHSNYLTAHQSLAGYATQTWVTTQISNLVNSAPEALNTLGELATALENHEDEYDALLSTVGGKLDKSGGIVTGDLTVTQDIVAGHMATDSFEATGQVSLGGSRIEHDGGGYYFDLPKKDGTAALTSDLNNYLPKTTYEYNKEIAFGSTGKLYIGAFPMYDSNITVEISATTSTTYNATLVIATQNINTTGGGSLTATVYGDATNTIAPNIYIGYASGSNQIHVYFSPQSWSKNLIHIQAVALAGAPSNVCTSVDSIPSTANRQPTNALTANFQAKGSYLTTSAAESTYMPLSGGIFTGDIKTIENAMGLKLRTHASYETGWVYGTSGNEAITLAMQNPVTAFQIVYGTQPSTFGSSTWQSVTPLFQTKDGKVIINRKIASTSDASNLKLFDVNGDANATTLYENGTALSNKYQAKGDYLTTSGVNGLITDHYEAVIEPVLDNKVDWSEMGSYLTTSTAQTISGVKTFSHSTFGTIVLKRNGSTNASAITFQNNNGTLGYIGMTDAVNSGLKRWPADISTVYTIWDSGNDGSGSGLDADKLDGQEGSYYQPKLTSGTNIKTINGTSLLGSGNIAISGGSGDSTLIWSGGSVISSVKSTIHSTAGSYAAIFLKAEIDMDPEGEGDIYYGTLIGTKPYSTSSYTYLTGFVYQHSSASRMQVCGEINASTWYLEADGSEVPYVWVRAISAIGHGG